MRRSARQRRRDWRQPGHPCSPWKRARPGAGPDPIRVAARPGAAIAARPGAVEPLAEERRRDAEASAASCFGGGASAACAASPSAASLALAGDAHGAMATLPPSLTRLVTQLHATDAAIDAALGEAATMAYMAKRDERLTRERSVRNDEKRAEVRALQTRVRVMWGSMRASFPRRRRRTRSSARRMQRRRSYGSSTGGASSSVARARSTPIG